MKTLRFAALGVAATLALAACANGSSADPSTAPSPAGPPAPATVRLWLAGGDTPDPLRKYLVDQFAAENPGSTLKIEQQEWTGLVDKLTTSLSSATETPDVVELGNTQAPTFTTAGAFLSLEDIRAEIGGDKLLKSFVEVGSVDGKLYAAPYYFGSRYVFYRKDVWQAAGATVPTTLAEFNTAVEKIKAANPHKVDNFSGLYLGGQDWRNGVSWVFTAGGTLAVKDGDTWKSSLSDPKTIAGLTQFQELQTSASTAPKDGKDVGPWLHLNDTDAVKDADGKVTEKYQMDAATIMAPGWARWSIGDLKKDGTREWNDDKFGVFVLPGTDASTPAAVFAGGSNIAISAKSQHPELAKNLMKIIFSQGYQELLGKNGLGPANTQYASALGDDQFATALRTSAIFSKLTPPAPGWASVEGAMLLEEFFGKVASGGDITALAGEYDGKIDKLING